MDKLIIRNGDRIIFETDDPIKIENAKRNLDAIQEIKDGFIQKIKKVTLSAISVTK